MNIRLLLTALLFIFCITPGLYAEYEISGNISHDSRVLLDKGIHNEDSTGEFNKSISRMELKVQRFDEEGFSMFSNIWITYDHLKPFYEQAYMSGGNSDSSDDRRLDYDELCLREAYVSANYGPLEIKAGQMIENWGRTDEINPIDIINPEDLSEFYTIEKLERKIPVLLFNCLLYIGDFTIQAAYIPFFEPVIIPDRGPWAQKMLVDFRNASPAIYEKLDFQDREKAGKRDIENSETAARLTGLLGSFDFGLVFFWGYNDQPGIKIDPLTQTYDVIYKKYHGYGFDFAYAISGYSLRGEFMYRDRILYGYQPTLFTTDNYESPDLQSVVGIDKTFGDNLYINIQVMYNRILHYKEDMLMDEEAIMGMGAVEDKFFRETLTIALDFYYGFKDEDWMIGPRIEYGLTENLKAKASGYFLDGPEEADLGQYAHNDMVMMQIEYSF